LRPVTVTKFFLRKNTETGTIDSVDFKLSGDAGSESSCAIRNPTLASATTHCGQEDTWARDYRFVLTKSEDASRKVTLSLYHQTGIASGLWNEAPAPALYCPAGGDCVGDFVYQ
jgi:hypothetical protein